MRPLNRLQRVLGIVGELFGVGFAARERAQLAVGVGNGVEAAVEQRIGNAGLRLHALGQRHESGARRADVEDEIGLERDHRFQVGRVAAPGEAADLGRVQTSGSM